MNEASVGGTSASEAERNFERDAVARFQRFMAQVVQRADHAALLRRNQLAVDVDLGTEACAFQFERCGVPASGRQLDFAAVPEPSFGGTRGVHRDARNQRCPGVVAVDAVFPRPFSPRSAWRVCADAAVAQRRSDSSRDAYFFIRVAVWCPKAKVGRSPRADVRIFPEKVGYFPDMPSGHLPDGKKTLSLPLK